MMEKLRLRREMMRRGFAAMRQGMEPDEWVAKELNEAEEAGINVETIMAILEAILPLLVLLFDRRKNR